MKFKDGHISRKKEFNVTKEQKDIQKGKDNRWTHRQTYRTN